MTPEHPEESPGAAGRDASALLCLALEYSAIARCFSSAECDEVNENLRLLASVSDVAEKPSLSLSPQESSLLREENTRLMSMSQGLPYEAAYEDDSRRLAIIGDVSGYYRAFGLAASEERPDSVVAELEFLAFLALLEARAGVSGEAERAAICREARASFIAEHAGRWLGALGRKLGEMGRLEFYPAIAERARALVLRDARALGAKVEEVGDGSDPDPADASNDPCKGCQALAGPTLDPS